jgi:HlyD family secretion protein
MQIIKKHKKNISFISIIAVIIIAVMIMKPDSKVDTTDNSSNKLQQVEMLNLNEYRENTNKISTTGQIEALEQVELSSEVFGKISYVSVKLGDQVYRGQTIASFSNGDLASQVNKMQAEYERTIITKDQLNAQYDSQEATTEKIRITAGNTIATAETSLQTAENNLKLNQNTSESKIVNDSYENLVNTLKSATVIMTNALTTSDNILGIDNTMANDTFQDLISVLSSSKLNTAESSYRQSKIKKITAEELVNQINITSTHESIDESANKIQIAIEQLQTHLFHMQEVLANTLPLGDLSQSELDTLKTNINTVQTSINTLSTNLTSSRQAVATAKNNLSSYQIAYDKAVRDLADTKAQADADIASANAQLLQLEANIRAQDSIIASARASVYNASANLGKTIIRSPINGTVAVLPAKAGEIVNNGGLIASIVNTTGMQVKTYIDSNNLIGIKKDNKAFIQNEPIGIVTNVAPSIDPMTKKVEVIIAITGETNTNFVVGQFIDIEIVQKLDNNSKEDTTSLLLPLTAVKIEPESKTIYILNTYNIVEEKEVQINRIIGDKIEITSGLENIENILLSTRGIDVGDKVEVTTK